MDIALEAVTKRYPGQPAAAVEDVTLHIRAGETVCFLGPSGCGKTTTMKMINRLIEPTSGRITLDGTDVTAMDPDTLRRGIGYVIQQIGLFPHMTIADNIALVPRLLGWSRGRVRARVEELLELVDLDPGVFARRYPRQLSGGQQQRVGVARALGADPPVMLMDEPFGATDPITRDRLQRQFRTLQQSLGKTVVFVTHDFAEAVRLGDRIVVLAERSRVVQYDTPERILAAPADDYVAGFRGSDAALQRLGLSTVDDATLEPDDAAAPDDAPEVTPSTSLKEALDRLVGSPRPHLLVRDEGGAVRGRLTFDAIRAVLGAGRPDEH
ncbi:ABC transporter ATP-binding protein [Dactylosporangium sp. CA-092794]|uniref:ABC transporter ATP-binding protein n=1 Tax=Dactylosporangium sp. CA-092794 TaxID=3239929 RepID=UPI003D8E7D43